MLRLNTGALIDARTSVVFGPEATPWPAERSARAATRSESGRLRSASTDSFDGIEVGPSVAGAGPADAVNDDESARRTTPAGGS
jgi:hypothetical protein